MLLKAFRSNQPILLVFLPLLGLVFWPFKAGQQFQEIVYGGPLFDLLMLWLADSFWLGQLLSLAAVYAGAVLINRIYNRFEFDERQIHLPALLYMLFGSFVTAIAGFNPVLPALFLILLAIHRLLLTYRVPQAYSHTFDAGAIFGLAILLSPPMAVVLPAIWLALFRLRPFSWREWLIPLVGLGCVAWLAFVCYVWFGLQLNLDEYLRFENVSWPQLATPSWLLWAFSILTAVPALGGLLLFISNMRISTVHRKNTRVGFLWFCTMLGLCFIYFGMLPRAGFGLYGLAAVPFSTFAAVFYNSKRLGGIKRIVFWLWLITAVAIFYQGWIS